MEDSGGRVVGSFAPGEETNVKAAAYRAGCSIDTIVRWCVRHGIGRQVDGARSHWRVSSVALEMFLAGDRAALARYCAGHRDTEEHRLYADLAKRHGTAARRVAA